jgi:hypothetical protein
VSQLRGKWAQGLRPRFFTWVVKDRLAAGERPGGFARNHRKVRRQEELIWLSAQGFTHVVSLLDSPHNLHAYEAAGLPYAHAPLVRHDDEAEHLRGAFETIAVFLDDPAEKLFVHHEEFGDRLLGALAGFLIYARFVESGPQTISIMEKLTGRNLGTEGRELVELTLAHGLRRPER